MDTLVEHSERTGFPWLMSNVVDNETGRPLAEGKVSHVLEWWGRKIGLVSEALTLKNGNLLYGGESFTILRTIIFFSWKHCFLSLDTERRDFFFFYPRVTRSPKREKMEGKSFASSPSPLLTVLLLFRFQKRQFAK